MNEYLKSFEFNSMLALFVYWIPLAICLSVYFFRTIKIYKQDLSQCTRERYDPELTIGLIVWYLLISIIPAVNLFALVFDCASSVFKWLGSMLDIPLVRKRKQAKSQ